MWGIYKVRMNNNMLVTAIAIVLVVGLGLLGYRMYRANKTGVNNNVAVIPTTMATIGETITPMVGNLLSNLNIDLAQLNNSNESGKATLVEENGQVKVTLMVDNEPAGANQPAHIHLGSCPTPGAVKYPLMNVVDGKSETVLNVTMDQLKSLQPLAINIHESAAKIGNYVSCGNLDLGGVTVSPTPALGY